MFHQAHARFNPFEAATVSFQVEQGRTVAEIVAACPGVPDWFWFDDPVGGLVCINGVPLARSEWSSHIPPPQTAITLHGKIHGGGKGGSTKNILTTVAAVALVAGATLVSGGLLGPAAAGTIGTGLLGATFAGGAIGAQLAAAGLGLAATFLLSTLTPPPISNRSQAQLTISQAGIAANVIRLLEPLPAVLGRIRYSPLQLAPAFTTFENETVTINAIVGCAGYYNQATIEASLLVNGNDIAEFAEAEYEVLPGSPSDPALTLIDYTVIEERRGTTLPNFVLVAKDSQFTELVHQATPDRDLPQWQLYRTRGDADQIWIRLFWPGGMVRSDQADKVFMPLRIEIRERGTLTWLKLPVPHITDQRKGVGSMRQEIKLIWGTAPSIDPDDAELNTFAIFWKTAPGQTFEYVAEDIFQGSTIIPVMTAATTDGVTVSANFETGGQEAWKAADSSRLATGTNWGTGTTHTTAIWQVDLGAGNAKTVRGYSLDADLDVLTSAPKDWTLEGSNNGSSWTVVDTRSNQTGWNALSFSSLTGTIGSYRYYRLNITDNNGASQIRLCDVALFQGATAVPDTLLASNVRVTESGCEIYLDATVFPQGEYDVRIKRGLAAELDVFNEDNYEYGGSSSDANFFDYVNDAGTFKVKVGQSRWNSECLIEQFSTMEDTYPFNPLIHTKGVQMTAVQIPNVTIDSLSYILHSIVPIYSGGVWSTDAPSNNPAALRRHVLLGQENALALPGEILNEEQHQDFYDFCVAGAHEYNGIIDGMSVLQVVDQIDAAGYGAKAFPSAQWGVIYEHDRSAETPVQVFTPANTRFLTVSLDLPKLPHAIRAEFFDEDDDWEISETLVYMDGYDANTAERIEAFPYPGFTDETKVETRALFDLRQLYLRPKRYTFEIGIEGLVAERGDLVSLIHDVTSRYYDYSRVKSIQTSGGDVTGLTLESRVNLGIAAGEVDTAMAAVIQIKDRTLGVHTVNEVTETDVVTFVTPFAIPLDGDGAPTLLAADCVVGFKLANFSTDHMVIKDIEFVDLFNRRITLVDEARGLHA